MKADSGFQDNYSVVVASGTWIYSIHTPCMYNGNLAVSKKPTCWPLYLVTYMPIILKKEL